MGFTPLFDGGSCRQSLSLSTFRPRLNQIEVDQHYNNYEDGSSSASISATVSYLKPKDYCAGYSRNIVLYRACLGKDPATKSDDFLEKFQTAFDPPPPSFLENYVIMGTFMQGDIGQIVSVNVNTIIEKTYPEP